MNIKRKVEIAEQSLRSISQHDDEDMAVRVAALDRVAAFVGSEKAAMQARVDAKIAASIGG